VASYTESIPAGGEGKVSLRVRTANYGGNLIVKHATVYTNDPDNTTISLVITGKVEKVAEIVPRQVLISGPAGAAIQKVVRITPEEKYAFAVTNVMTQSGKYIDAKIEKTTYRGRPSYNLVVTNKMGKPGNYIDYIYVATDSKVEPRLRIRVRGTIFAPSGK